MEEGERGAVQISVNMAFWGSDRHLRHYTSGALKPAEAAVLEGERERFSGRVMDIGCGGGRMLGHLLEVATEVEGIDVSPSMIAYCRAHYPAAETRIGDLRRLEDALSGTYDVVLASDNVLDILDDTERRRFLSEIGERYLTPTGILVFSSHNLANLDHPAGAASVTGDRRGRMAELARKALGRSPAKAMGGLGRQLRGVVNRRRLAALEYRAPDHAVINDVAHEYSLLHYYIRRDDQARQLEQVGLRLRGCFELDGTVLAAGQDGAGPSLYYVAAAR